MTDIVERLRERARSASEASKLLARAKTERNAAAEGTVIPPEQGYRGLEPEQTIEWEAANEIERLRSQLAAAPPSPVSGEGDERALAAIAMFPHSITASEIHLGLAKETIDPLQSYITVEQALPYVDSVRVAAPSRPPEPAASGDEPAVSREAMVAAVELEIERTLGFVTTRSIGALVQKAADAINEARQLPAPAPDTGEWNAAVEACARHANDWLTLFADRRPEYVSAQKWAVDAVKDIADAILALKRPAPQRERASDKKPDLIGDQRIGVGGIERGEHLAQQSDDAAYMSREGMNVDLTETERQLRKQEEEWSRLSTKGETP